MSMNENRYLLNIEQVRKFLPHRQPFLLIDRVLEIHPVGDLSKPEGGPDRVGTKVVAIKNVSYNEPFFAGHFPQFAIMPGVLIVEAMAQAASFSLYPSVEGMLDELQDRFQCILLGVDSARFRKPVIPGDTLRIETEVTKVRGKMWGFTTTAFVDGQKVAEAEMLANIMIQGASS